MTEEDILKALKNVINPDSQKDIVSLNMVSEIKIHDKNIAITIMVPMTAAPYKAEINEQCENVIKELAKDQTVNVNVTFTSKVNTKRSLHETVLPKVKNIIAVVSGKGGVGKSTVAANLAIALSKDGVKVGLMDADIYGPSAPIMFGLRGDRPKMADIEGKGKIVPIEKFGIKVMSIGFLVDERQAVVWRGPMVSSAVRQFVTDVYWDELDYLVIDMPPGTGDIHLTLMQLVPVTGVIIVTTPQDVALADAKKGIAMFGQAQLDAPIIGLVENMAYFTPAELPENKYYIFGKEGGKRLASEYDLNFLGQIPLVQSIREGGDKGVPVMLSEDAVSRKAFEAFADEVAKQVQRRNEML
ncbi:Mrp/NBP35 family ATP-binding protein [Arachidicoccus soli]|uniref:Iron-sulfur cluster carrier protein n=1 Tax=Arachidicoccus soli TaxID=2341117 RepID=A0A386HPI5_9BACT|nr:Mrp/NBP35 family ATP-binding protein [Arachidicoccus soli]AYD47194.1 iron-sulfur cluster carrier protein ApbC [Arachidicoccus soli]